MREGEREGRRERCYKDQVVTDMKTCNTNMTDNVGMKNWQKQKHRDHNMAVTSAATTAMSTGAVFVVTSPTSLFSH